MDERTFINQLDIKSDKAYQKMPMRSNFPKEIFETEQRFGVKIVGIIFQKKESGSPDFTVDFIVDEGDNDEWSYVWLIIYYRSILWYNI